MLNKLDLQKQNAGAANDERIKNAFRDWLAQHATTGIENVLEQILAPILLSSVVENPLLDIFPFNADTIEYSNSFSHTTYKIPNNANYDAFIKEEGLTITINNGSFAGNWFINAETTIENWFKSHKNARGENVGVFDALIFSFLGAHQTKFPITLTTTKGVFPVLMERYSITESAGQNFFNATFKRTSFFQTTKFTYQGQPIKPDKKVFSNPKG